MTEDEIATGSRANAAEAAILDLARERGCGKSISPAEAARRLAEHDGNAGATDAWRRHMPAIRRAALRLAQSGTIDILRKGKVIPPEAARGVIRLRLREIMEERP